MFADVSLAFNGQLFGNNSIITISDIGEGAHSALLCITNNSDCCDPGDSSSVMGAWYLPNGRPADGNDQSFYQSRGPSVVRLSKKVSTTAPSGIFKCQVTDASGILQNVFVGLYLSNLGELQI